MARRRNKALERAIARQRVDRLLALAERAARAGRTEDARRYGGLARRVSMRYVLSAAPELRTRVCRSCSSFLLPGRTSRVRLTPAGVSTTCLSCHRVRRVPLRRERAQRRMAADAPLPLGRPG